MVRNSRFSLTAFLLRSNQHPVPPRSEASSGDNQRAEAGAAPAGGVTNRTRATTGHYDPDAVGAAAVERRKASAPIARGTGTPRKRPSAWLAPTPRCGSHPHRAPFRRSAPSFEGDVKKARARAPRRPEAAKRAAQRWLLRRSVG